jgi:hypothetical protein
MILSSDRVRRYMSSPYTPPGGLIAVHNHEVRTPSDPDSTLYYNTQILALLKCLNHFRIPFLLRRTERPLSRTPCTAFDARLVTEYNLRSFVLRLILTRQNPLKSFTDHFRIKEWPPFALLFYYIIGFKDSLEGTPREGWSNVCANFIIGLFRIGSNVFYDTDDIPRT